MSQGGAPVPARPRVLLIAEAANPEWVSVPLIGWSLSRALAEVADVHIVTQVRNRDAFLRAGLAEGRDFTAIDNERIARPLWALGERLRLGEGRGFTALQAVSALAYPAFERQIWRRFGADLRAGRFDLVHRITPLSPTITSPLAPRLAALGVPFVLGPLNGGVPWPRAFAAEQRREREFLAHVRAAYKLWPGRRRALAATAAILAGSCHTASELPAWVAGRLFWLPENGVDPARFSARSRPEGAPLRVAFVGRLVPYKGPDMLLEAARPLLEAGLVELDIVGDGPMRAALEAQGARLEGVRFHGWLAQDQVQRVLAQAGLLALPSIREFGGGVVLEAMYMGVPPLVVDYGGPGELVGEGLGFKVPLGPRAAVVAGFRAELARLAAEPELLRETGEAGRAHVQHHFTWAAKARQIGQVYDWVLQGGGAGQAPRPDLGVAPAPGG